MWAFYGVFVGRGQSGGVALENDFWLDQVTDYLDGYRKVGIPSVTSCYFSGFFVRVLFDSVMPFVYFVRLPHWFLPTTQSLCLTLHTYSFFLSRYGKCDIRRRVTTSTLHSAVQDVSHCNSALTEGLSHCVSLVWFRIPAKLRFFKTISELEVMFPAVKNWFLRWAVVEIQIDIMSRGVMRLCISGCV